MLRITSQRFDPSFREEKRYTEGWNEEVDRGINPRRRQYYIEIERHGKPDERMQDGESSFELAISIAKDLFRELVSEEEDFDAVRVIDDEGEIQKTFYKDTGTDTSYRDVDYGL